MYAPMGMAPGMEPPELASLKSMLHVTKIVALIWMILSLIGALALFAVFALASAVVGVVYSGVGWGVFLFLGFIFTILIYVMVGQINDMVNAGQLVAAKEKTLLWMIIGIIFSLIPMGILLIICYVKFAGAISAVQRMQAGGGWGQPPMQQAPAWQAPPTAAPMAPVATPAAPMPPMAAAAPAGATCPRCGRPATWIAQYNRWYCYNDQQYL